jgi:hypothetical protein
VSLHAPRDWVLVEAQGQCSETQQASQGFGLGLKNAAGVPHLKRVVQEAEGRGDPGSICLSKRAALEGVEQEAEGHGDPGVVQPAAVAVQQQEGREWDSDAEEQSAGDAYHEDGSQLRPGVALLVHVLLPVAAAPGRLWDRQTDIQTQ